MSILAAFINKNILYLVESRIKAATYLKVNDRYCRDLTAKVWELSKNRGVWAGAISSLRRSILDVYGAKHHNEVSL